MAASRKAVELKHVGPKIVAEDDADQAGPNKLIAWAIFAIVLAVSLSFAIYTNHAWEDFYITFRSSKNLATGNGLVFTPGQRVHAFTSPLNVLIPAGLSYATGNNSDTLVLWLFRLVSAVALAVAAVLLYQIAKSQSLKKLAVFVLIGLFATNAKIVDFSINGQETGLMMFFLALTLHSLLVPVRAAPLRLGLAWAGLMWTRPDGWLYAALIAVAFLLFNAGLPGERSRMQLLKTFLAAGALAAVIYLPWVIWTWSYYGTPVPHTMIAKALDAPMNPLAIAQRSFDFLLRAIPIGNEMTYPFAPVEHFFGGWHETILFLCACPAWLAAWYWLLPFGNRDTRAVSFAFFLGIWYIDAVPPVSAEWYYPNVGILAICVVGQIVQQASDVLSAFRRGLNNQRVFNQVQWMYRGLAVALPTFTALLLVASAVQLRIQQREIEDGNRKQIGIWLREHAKSPGDTVMLEPLGYIGYFSQLKMLDYPGLSSPEVVAARKRHPGAPAVALVDDLKPDWLVLRQHELDDVVHDANSTVRDKYRIAKAFDASKRLEAYTLIPGRGYVEYDQTFYVLKRLDQ